MKKFGSSARICGSLLAFATVALGVRVAAPGEAAAADLACSELSPELRKDPVTSGVFKVVETYNLYRFQERPYMRLPSGVRVKLLAPQGVTSADLHRAAACSRRWITDDARSPLAVSGGRVRVEQRGGHFDLHITAQERSTAREIQVRAARLR